MSLLTTTIKDGGKNLQESFEGDGVLTTSESLIQGCGIQLEAFDGSDEGNDDVLSIHGHLLFHLEVRVLEGYLQVFEQKVAAALFVNSSEYDLNLMPITLLICVGHQLIKLIHMHLSFPLTRV